jgi:hypothetical protein
MAAPSDTDQREEYWPHEQASRYTSRNRPSGRYVFISGFLPQEQRRISGFIMAFLVHQMSIGFIDQ